MPGEGGGGGVLWISSDGDDQRIFGGLKFSIPRFFGVGKFGKCFFWGALIKVAIFFRYSKQSKVCLFAWDTLVLNFGPSICFGFCWKP